MSTDCVTSSARVAALSDRLLTISDVERILAASDLTEAIRVLHDLSWADSLAESSDSEDFEAVISAGLHEIKMVLVHSDLPRDILEVLLLPFDLQNAKASLAAHAKGLSYDDIRNNLSPLALFPRRTAFDVLTGKGGVPISASFFEKAVLRGADMVQKDESALQSAQLELDISFLEHIDTAIKKIDSPHLTEFFQKQIDVENIKKAVRQSAEEKPRFLAPGKGVPGIPTTLSYEEVIGTLEKSKFSSFLEEGKVLAAEKKSLSQWEVSMDMTLLHTLFWVAKANPTDPESLVLFFLTKLRNAEVLRTLLVGKRNSFSSEEIRGSLEPFLEFFPKN